jgi:hypothetical protein
LGKEVWGGGWGKSVDGKKKKKAGAHAQAFIF